jgi:hypothetical protein
LEQCVRDKLAAHTPTAVINVITMPHASDPPVESANGHTPSSGSGLVETIAAAASLQILRRLPSSAFPEIAAPHFAASQIAASLIRSSDRARRVDSQSTSRQSGSRLARAQGIVLHALLQQAASGDSGARPDWSRLATALLRQHALSLAETAAAHEVILRGLQNALQDEHGRWLLTPGASSYNERSWTSLSGERILRQRPDLVFLGGSIPQEPGSDYLWIIDYKTAALPVGEDREGFLSASREQYREQLVQYSELFRKMDSTTARLGHRLALYHPLLPWLDWWPA